MKKQKVNNDAVYVGIDPDKDKSGVAVIIDNEITLFDGSFAEVYKEIMMLNRSCKRPVKVYIEAAWLSKGNWHLNPSDSIFVASKIGYSIGENHTVGRLLYELLLDNGVDVTPIKPLAKFWGNKTKKPDAKPKRTNDKISHEELAQELANFGISGLGKTSNPEKRDAALIALWYSMI